MDGNDPTLNDPTLNDAALNDATLNDAFVSGKESARSAQTTASDNNQEEEMESQRKKRAREKSDAVEDRLPFDAAEMETAAEAIIHENRRRRNGLGAYLRGIQRGCW